MTKWDNVKVARVGSLGGVLFGAVTIGVWTVLAALMALSFGLWPIVVWPAAVFFYLKRMALSVAAYKKNVADAEKIAAGFAKLPKPF